MSGLIDTSLFVAQGANLRSFVKQAEISAPVASVFAAWANGDGWSRAFSSAWAEARANIDLEIGGRYEWLFDGKIGGNGCQILSYIPNRMLSFSWNAPPTQPVTREKRTWVVVEFDAPSETTTRLTLTHLGFGEGPAWDETHAYFVKAWDVVLERMGAAFASAS